MIRPRPLFVSFFAAHVALSALAQPIAVEDIARLPQLSSVTISDDGTYLAMLVAPADGKAERPSIATLDLRSPGAAMKIARADGDVEFVGASALKAGKVLALARKPYNGETYGCDGEGTRGVTRTFTNKFFITDAGLGKFEDPFALPAMMIGRSDGMRRCFEMAIRGTIRSDLLTLDPNSVVIAEFDIYSLRTEYRKYNLATGKSDLLFADTSDDTIGYIAPRDATAWSMTRTKAEGDDYRFDTLLRNAETGAFEIHEALAWRARDRRTVSIVGREEATGRFYVLTNLFNDRTELHWYDPKTRAFGKAPIFSDPEFDATGAVFSDREADFGALLGVAYAADTVRYEWIDPALKAVDIGARKLFPGEIVTITDYSRDRSKVVVMTNAGNRPPRYFLIENGKKVVSIGEAAAHIKSAGLNPTRLVYYTARDGLKIPALLTLPAGWRDGDKPAPAVILPHGGPWARDYADWDLSGWVPFLASRGFAVLQPQFRGSTGWGRALWLAGDAEWGLKMQDDKDDGAKWLVDTKVADPEKLILFGYSYGGYAAFAAAVRENSPYQCLIAGAGVSDVKRLGRNWSDNRLQRILFGRTVKGLNPIEEAGKAATPMLIFHGDRDVRVPISHSKSFFDAAKGKAPTRFVEIKDMPHSLPWTPAQQRATLSAIEDFLETGCKFGE